MPDLYEHINESLAAIRRHRPVWRERYSLDPPWTIERLAEFERKHRCNLPEEYRGFLLHVGIAGTGPDYGLFAPHQHFSGSGFEGCLDDDPDLSIPFPHEKSWNDLPEGLIDWDNDYFSSRHSNGSLIISDRGCALWTRLIVTGPLAGQIWYEDRADGLGLRPALAPDGSTYRFLQWYIDWLDLEFYQYGHEGQARQKPRSINLME